MLRISSAESTPSLHHQATTFLGLAQPQRPLASIKSKQVMASSTRNTRSWFRPWSKPREMDNASATSWLSQFIGKNLRIHASDGRVFGGQMKCTDKVSSHLFPLFKR
jgi:hypothetical protein